MESPSWKTLGRRTDEDDGKIDGYNDSSRPSSSPPRSPAKCRQQLEGDFDDDDVERLLSRPVSRWKLALYEAPEFVQRLRAYEEVEVGETVSFSAQYRAFPKPTVKWFKDEEEVRPTERHQLDESSESSGIIRLLINDVLATDEGPYKCKVENSEGVASTTGYLSVAGRPCTGSRSSRGGGKLQASDRTAVVSSPPVLGPIAEQKSMEEREEIELSHQPPSPLQDFINNIKRSAKSRHAPIFYGTGDIFSVQDGSNSEEDDDVFGEEEFSPSITPVDGLDSEEEMEEQWNEQNSSSSVCICAIDSFHPEIDDVTDWMLPDTVVDGTLASDRNSHVDRSVGEVDPASWDDHADTRSANGFQRSRLRRLQLQHRLAIDLPDYSPPVSETSSSVDRQTESTAAESSLSEDQGPGNENTLPGGVEEDADSLQLVLEAVCDEVFRAVDSHDVRFYVALVICFTALALVLNVSPVCLLFVVAIVSTVNFCLDDQRNGCRTNKGEII